MTTFDTNGHSPLMFCFALRHRSELSSQIATRGQRQGLKQRQGPGGLHIHGLVQNQNLGRLGNLALLHLSRCVDECGGGNIHGGFLLRLSLILVRPPTLLSRWRSEVHQYRAVMAAKRARFTYSLFSIPASLFWSTNTTSPDFGSTTARTGGSVADS